MAKALKQQATEQIVAQLANEGARILRQCVEQRDYTHRSYNLYDSYGYGVYVSGKLQRYGFLGTQKATDPRKWYGEDVRGRDEILEYLKSEHKPSNDAVELVIAAAMPYAKVLESGGGGIKHKYKVISMSYDMLKDIAPKYGGTVKTLTGNGKQG